MIQINMEIPKGCAGCPLEHKALNFCGYSDFIKICDDKRPSNCPLKEIPQDTSIDELRVEITTLQNRCYALTKGTMCAFCKYECEYKAESEPQESEDKK